MSDTAVIEREKVDIELKEPGQYLIVIHNDDVTPFSFVINLLMRVFKYELIPAVEMSETIDQQGKGIVARYPYEIAHQKANEAKTIVQINNMVLQITVEKE